MEDIKWLEVAVNTTPERLDEVTAKLTAAGMASVVIEDEGDFKQFLEQNRQYWDYVDQELLDRMAGVCRVKFYVNTRSSVGSSWPGTPRGWTASTPPPPCRRTTGPTAGRNTISPW